MDAARRDDGGEIVLSRPLSTTPCLLLLNTEPPTQTQTEKQKNRKHQNLKDNRSRSLRGSTLHITLTLHFLSRAQFLGEMATLFLSPAFFSCAFHPHRMRQCLFPLAPEPTNKTTQPTTPVCVPVCECVCLCVSVCVSVLSSHPPLLAWDGEVGVTFLSLSRSPTFSFALLLSSVCGGFFFVLSFFQQPQ